MRIIKLMALAALMAMPNLAQAADAAPSADTVRQVMSYYRDGNTVILVEAKLCKEIGKEGDTKSECVDEITDGKVKKGDKAYVWLNFFVPGENTDTRNVLIQFSSKGMVLQSNQVHMKQTTRYRTWYLLPTGKDGDWDIAASQEEAQDYVKIGGLKYSVEEAAPAAQ
ncbi:MAG TPA: hypothetical protein VNI58_09400 [Mariprofundaceae bacterium]|nr:hypothetical protein [Mariprofundaceae bacterium]